VSKGAAGVHMDICTCGIVYTYMYVVAFYTNSVNTHTSCYTGLEKRLKLNKQLLNLLAKMTGK